ncbi:MAG: hypothetical protein QM817_08160 [Archangium sp.]
MRALWLSMLVAVPVGAAPTCKPELSKGFTTLKGTKLEERTQVVFGLVADLCSDALSPGLQRNLSALAYSKPEARLALIAAIGKNEEAGADFELTCPAWPKLLSNADFFKECEFAKQGVFTADEFAKVDVRLATLTVVVFDALKRAGVDKKFARQLTRVALFPLEAGPAPAPPDPVKEQQKVREVMKKALEQKD